MKIIIIGIALLIIPFGIRSGFGLFVGPISLARGWSVDVFSLTLAIQFLLFGFFAPFIGFLCDRFGGGRIYALGAFIFAVAFFVFGFIEKVLPMHLVGGVLMALGIAGTSVGVVLPVMAKAVPSNRQSVVLGLGSGIAASGQFFLPPLLQWLIGFGVGVSFNILAAALCIVSLVAFFFLRPVRAAVASSAVASQKGEEETVNKNTINITEVAKIAKTAESVTRQSSSSFNRKIKLAMRSASLWWLAIGFASCGFYVSFVVVHMPHYLRMQGFSLFSGANSISLIGLFNVFGCYIAGHIGAVYSQKFSLIWLYLCRFFLIVIFLSFPITQLGVYIFSVLAGLLWLSTVPLTMGLITKLYGLKHTTTIYGVVFLFHQLGGFAGIYLGSKSYQLYESYLPVWWLMAGLSLLSVVLHLPLKEEYLLKHEK